MRGLQRRNIERGDDGTDLGIAEHTQDAGKPAAKPIQGLAGLQQRTDRKQVFHDLGRTDAGQRALHVASGHGGRYSQNRICRGELQLADRRLNFVAGAGFAYLDQRRLESARLVGRAVAQQPLPHRQERCAANLARPRRGIAIDQKRLERTEQ